MSETQNVATLTAAQTRTPSGKLRARGLGVPFVGEPGPLNAITDVSGVEVGYRTLIEGDGPLVVGKGPVRTGVTGIFPRGRAGIATPVFSGAFSLNGNGEMTGLLYVEETGLCAGPIAITNTNAAGVARDAINKWMMRNLPPDAQPDFGLPVAGETWDGWLSDINGFHVRDEHVFDALDAARPGAIEEGSVGGGTGMIAYEFKGGSGTASRRVACAGEVFTVGVFVQANFGRRDDLTIAGVPVGPHLPGERVVRPASSSIIAVVATDAPLLPHQLKRIARRVGLGMARGGAYASHSSGDVFFAFSTANDKAAAVEDTRTMAEFLPDPAISPLFQATAQATEEAIVNAMIANETMVGIDGRVVVALPHDELVALLKRHGRM